MIWYIMGVFSMKTLKVISPQSWATFVGPPCIYILNIINCYSLSLNVPLFPALVLPECLPPSPLCTSLNVLPLPGMEEEVRRLRDIGNQRLETLRAKHADTHRAVLWLRDNQALFHRTVHEPMMLTVGIVRTVHEPMMLTVGTVRTAHEPKMLTVGIFQKFYFFSFLLTFFY